MTTRKALQIFPEESYSSNDVKKDYTSKDDEKIAESLLDNILQRLYHFGDPPYSPPNSEDDSEAENQKEIEISGNELVLCACCLLPLEKGDFCINMPCCGFSVHLACIAQVANGHRYRMNHVCPHCTSDLSESTESTVIKLWQVLKSKK